MAVITSHVSFVRTSPTPLYEWLRVSCPWKRVMEMMVVPAVNYILLQIILGCHSIRLLEKQNTNLKQVVKL